MCLRTFSIARNCMNRTTTCRSTISTTIQPAFLQYSKHSIEEGLEKLRQAR